MNDEKHFIYRGPKFPEPEIELITYRTEYFQQELDLESEVFYELRKANDIHPYKINESNQEELENIKKFFDLHQNSFFIYRRR